MMPVIKIICAYDYCQFHEAVSQLVLSHKINNYEKMHADESVAAGKFCNLCTG